MTNLDQLEARKAEIKAERQRLFNRREPIDRKLTSTYNELRKIDEKIGKLRIEAGVDLAFLLDPKNLEAGSAIYNQRQKVIRELGLYYSGCWADTVQPVLQLIMTHGSQESFDKTIVAIKTVAPHLIPHEDGFLWFGVFEHTLSEYGIYRFHVTPDLTSAELCVTRYGHKSNVTKGTLEEVVKYIQDRHWYDGGEYDDDDY